MAYCPTRRDVFSREKAIRYAQMIREGLSRYPIKLIDLTGINEEELLFCDDDLPAVIQRFRAAQADAVFFPHCNFGSENLVSQVARALQVPVLLWGPRDNPPSENGFRDRDSQCGLFATGKVLRRHNVPFTYLVNSWVNSAEFHEGFSRFLSVVHVVKSLRNLRILQISTRPELFCSVMCNENELLEKFNIHIYPISLPELAKEVDRVLAEKPDDFNQTQELVGRLNQQGSADQVSKVAALKVAIKRIAQHFKCAAVAIQCWNALEDMLGIMPCLANALLTDDGIPVACETDIHGAISAVMVQAATMKKSVPFFADITVRHPENDNAELLWHCGNFPYSLAADPTTATAGRNLYNADKCYGICEWELRPGDLTIVRFDGDHGCYQLLIGEAHTTTGPKNVGSYVWIETGDWPKWERKLVEGPYIHHVAVCYGHIGEILLEACRYIPGLNADVVEPSEDSLRARWQ